MAAATTAAMEGLLVVVVVVVVATTAVLEGQVLLVQEQPTVMVVGLPVVARVGLLKQVWERP